MTNYARQQANRGPRYVYPTSIRLDPELKTYLLQVAERESRSISYVIVEILKAWREYQAKKGKV